MFVIIEQKNTVIEGVYLEIYQGVSIYGNKKVEDGFYLILFLN